MNNYIDLLKRALKDPELKDFPCVCPANKSDLLLRLKDVPEGKYISEFRYGPGTPDYRYHQHTPLFGEKLGNALKKSRERARRGNPKLIWVYPKEVLEEIILGFEEDCRHE